MRRHGRILDTGKVDDLLGEKWADIKGLEGRYQVSDLGRVKSFIGVGEKLATAYYCAHEKNIHVHVTRKEKHYSNVRLHYLVANAFCDNLYKDKKVIFLDGNKKNCRADNLQWFGTYWHDKSLSILKEQAIENDDAKDIVTFMEGDKKGLDRILRRQISKSHKLIKYIIFQYPSVRKKQIDLESVVQESLLKAVNAIERGLLRNVNYLDRWVEVIIKNTFKNVAIKEPIFLSDTYCNDYNSDSELNFIDYAIQKGFARNI